MCGAYSPSFKKCLSGVCCNFYLESCGEYGCEEYCQSGGNAYRYMTEGELEAIQNTGLLRGGRAGETYWTKDLYKSALKAQDRLSLPSTPTLRVEFETINNPTLLKNGTKVLPNYGMRGQGAEFMTLDPMKIRLINWQPLR